MKAALENGKVNASEIGYRIYLQMSLYADYTRNNTYIADEISADDQHGIAVMQPNFTITDYITDSTWAAIIIFGLTTATVVT